jgi:hypothetical protein
VVIPNEKIAIEFGISKTQVQQIGKNQEEILLGVDSGDLKLSVKVTKNMSENKELDDAVYDWFLEMRNPKFRKTFVNFTCTYSSSCVT